MVAVSRRINHSSVLQKALNRITEFWDLGQKQLGDILGFKQAVVSNILTGKRKITEHSKEEETILLLIRAFRALDAMMGGKYNNQKKWLNSYNNALNGIPLDLMKSYQGLVHVVGYLDAIRGKN